ncbi:uncharacterized protein L969DRAFT_17524 [Mixia osmundae IAM 14324]|uniref:RING-type E3 ubiquitin transferase (cysteine targeting) n=1 Tax=Mixia osmundae (strain CBS 9802 / IAM 14324 / JCM 22182 / KY 12970) TaxID=764103 RepID=G7DVV9_MIXOS|nr:uncharacterized protein L969DRAFT_17524 [Mixia osmundae IAM 14324]KEI39602.1 hypothetical protein L969DRAFT_17524 [Mixia osmundae IAM 14324]GAA94719.1 hypothetical protein E5Q_01372 [Mixia osmundae IAM 14324]
MQGSSSAAFYADAALQAKPEIENLRHGLADFKAPPLRITRVGQLDAELLDRELESILREPVSRALQNLRGSGRSSLEPELKALLQFFILRLSIYESGASYGATLQNLKYRNEWLHGGNLESSPARQPLTKLQLHAYTALNVLPTYAHAKARDFMLSKGWGDYPTPRSYTSLLFHPFDAPASSSAVSRRERRDKRKREWKRAVWKALNLAERTWAVLKLANFLVFLYDGRYRTLIDRILGMRLTYAHRAVTRNVSFEFLNRQLVWEAFTEFLLFLMPLINFRKLRQRLNRWATTSRPIEILLAALPAPVRRTLNLPDPRHSTSSRKGKDKEETRGPLDFLPDHICPICYTNSIAPPTVVPDGGVISSDPADPGASTSALATLESHSQINHHGDQDNGVKIPYQVDCCQGLYCYFCIVNKLVQWEEDNSDTQEYWPCLRCGKGVKSVIRQVPVVEESPTVEPEEDSEDERGGTDDEQDQSALVDLPAAEEKWDE